jgi:hypothetical protein
MPFFDNGCIDSRSHEMRRMVFEAGVISSFMFIGVPDSHIQHGCIIDQIASNDSEN